MSRATDDLREHLWVMNATEYLRQGGTGRVFVDYHPSGHRYAAWVVAGLGFDTDPGGHFSNYGDKRFSVPSRADKAPALAVALAWAGEHYDVADWEKSPFGAWVPAGTNAIMKDKLKVAKANPDLKCYATQVPFQEGWDDRRGVHTTGRAVSVWIAARSRADAASYLGKLGFTTDPATLDLIHPDRLKNMVEGEVGADLGHFGQSALPAARTGT